MMYPRKYIIEQGEQCEIVSFFWEQPGYSLWGIRAIGLFLKLKMNGKIIHKTQSALESQWVLQIGNDQLSLYQEDMISLDVSIMKGSDSAIMKNVIHIFHNSNLFKEIKYGT
ncbi:MAG: hypothetical protein GY754_17050 [bacterium]|nr:hypothetical protein [bacterium]